MAHNSEDITRCCSPMAFQNKEVVKMPAKASRLRPRRDIIWKSSAQYNESHVYKCNLINTG